MIEVSRVVEFTGMSHLTINKGIRELKNTEKLEVPERLHPLASTIQEEMRAWLTLERAMTPPGLP